MSKNKRKQKAPVYQGYGKSYEEAWHDAWRKVPQEEVGTARVILNVPECTGCYYVACKGERAWMCVHPKKPRGTRHPRVINGTPVASRWCGGEFRKLWRVGLGRKRRRAS